MSNLAILDHQPSYADQARSKNLFYLSKSLFAP